MRVYCSSGDLGNKHAAGKWWINITTGAQKLRGTFVDGEEEWVFRDWEIKGKVRAFCELSKLDSKWEPHSLYIIRFMTSTQPYQLPESQFLSIQDVIICAFFFFYNDQKDLMLKMLWPTHLIKHTHNIINMLG